MISPVGGVLMALRVKLVAASESAGTNSTVALPSGHNAGRGIRQTGSRSITFWLRVGQLKRTIRRMALPNPALVSPSPIGPRAPLVPVALGVTAAIVADRVLAISIP